MLINDILKDLVYYTNHEIKRKILAANKQNEILKGILDFSCNTPQGFPILAYPGEEEGSGTFEEYYKEIFEFLQFARTRNMPYVELNDKVNSFRQILNKNSQFILFNILGRAYKNAIPIEILNEVWPGIFNLPEGTQNV